MRLAIILALAVLALTLTVAFAANTIEEFKKTPFFRLVEKLESSVYRIQRIDVCSGGCRVVFATRDLAEGVVSVYTFDGFHAVFENVSLSFSLEPVPSESGEINATILSCYFNASRVVLSAPNITGYVKPGSHMLYMVKLPEPVRLELPGVGVFLVKGFAFIVTPEALRRHMVERIGNDTIVFGESTGVIPDGEIIAGNVTLLVGHAHPLPPQVYILYVEAKEGAEEGARTVTIEAGSPGRLGGMRASTLVYIAVAGVAAAAAATVYASRRGR